jgi:hypothetical protein
MWRGLSIAVNVTNVSPLLIIARFSVRLRNADRLLPGYMQLAGE